MQNNSPTQRSVIVAADDDGEDIDLLRLLFRKAGAHESLEFFRSGEEIVASLSSFLRAAAKTIAPLACFLDVKMPGMNGIEVLEWIRRHAVFDFLPVVMLSSSEHPADVRRAANAGAQCYLAKYPQPAVLRSVIEEANRYTHRGLPHEWFGLPANLLLRWGLSKEIGLAGG